MIEKREVDYYLDLVHYQNERNSLKKPYLVAALDVLGFSNHVMSNKTTNFLYDDVFWVLAAMKSIEDELADERTSVFARFFSDCIFILFPLDYKAINGSEFNSFLQMIAGLIETALSNGFLIRGGLSIGECTINSTMMWGPGIIKSHILEDKVSKTGRVIIEQRDYKQLNNYLKYVLEDMEYPDYNRYFIVEEDGYLSFDSTRFILEVLYVDMDAPVALDRYRNLLSIVKENILYTSANGNREKNLSKLSWHMQRYNEFALRFSQTEVLLETL